MGEAHDCFEGDEHCFILMDVVLPGRITEFGIIAPAVIHRCCIIALIDLAVLLFEDHRDTEGGRVSEVDQLH